jgi:PAS domain S-box-containing protein
MNWLIAGALALALLALAALAWHGRRQRDALGRQLQALQSELVQRNGALQESEALRKALTESGAAGLILTDPPGHILYVNERWLALHGYTREDTRTLQALALYADGPQRRAQVLHALERDGHLRGREVRLLRKNGTSFWGLLDATPITVGGQPLLATWVLDITGRKLAEKALRDSEAFNRMLFRESTIAMAVYDLQAHRFVDGNDAAARLYGLSDRAALIGKSVWDVSPQLPPSGGPTLDALTACHEASVDDEHHVRQIAWPHRRPGGEAWVADTRVVRYRFQGRTLLQFTLLDATAARAAQQSVEDMSTFLQRSIDHIPNAVFYKGPDGRLLGCNQAFEEMFGFRREDLMGQRVEEVQQLPADLRELLQREDDHVLATAGTVQRETQWAFADGKVHRTLYAVNGFRRPDGSPGGLVGTVVDMEPLKAAEDALRVAHAAQMAVFETASVGICILHQGVVLRCNRELERIFGYGPGELDQQRTRIWYPSDAAYESGRALANAGIGSGQRHDQQVRRKNGEMFWCRMRSQFIDPNSTHGSVWVMEDVTEENAAAEALREAKRLADEAVATKSRFLANVSHEIRTPMNAIIGLSHLALKTELSARQRDYVSKVHGAGTALLRVVNDILDFSRIESGRMEMESSPFRIDDVLQAVSTAMADKAAGKGLALQMQADPQLPAVLWGDARRLDQILTNLVGNAIKFTSAGQVQVSATQHSRTADALVLRLEVRDSGIGMDEAQCARLFEPFSQADGTATRKYGGTGLGLSICKRLVQAMGGQIDVQSTPGQGSVFGFSVHLGWREAAPAPQAGTGRVHGPGAADAAQGLATAALGLDASASRSMPVASSASTPTGAPAHTAPLRSPAPDSLLFSSAPAPASTSTSAATATSASTSASRPPPPAPVDAALAQVPGLDAATGLSRVAGNHALYRQLLKQFVERQGDAPARVAQALAAGEPAAAQRAAHTVRAVAGNLGLATLQQAAAALEQALAHSEPHGEQLTAFEHQLHDALQSLGAALRESDARASAAAQAAATQAAQADAAAQAQAQAGTGAADQALATEHATTLARLLAADDAEAADFFAAQRDAFRALLDAPALAALERALADFDFDAALQQLQAAVPMGDVVP